MTQNISRRDDEDDEFDDERANGKDMMMFDRR
jgi:hypothetical protein